MLTDLALALLLAQTCAAEIGLRPDGAPECAVMWAINAKRADRAGIPLSVQTRGFNAYWRRSGRGRQWVASLRMDGRTPDPWPASYGPWKRFSRAWARYRAAALDFVARYRAGTLRKLTCGADDYGGTPGDGVDADDPAPCPQARRVSCLPGERQAYWVTAACRR
jgi:hypothetical protein